MNRRVWTVFRKELLETLRDRRTLLVMILVPVLLYPGLLVITEQLALVGAQRLAGEAASVGFVEGGWPELEVWLDTRDDLTLEPLGQGAQAAAAVRDDRVRVGVLVERDGEGRPTIRILHDAADDRSRRARGLVVEALSDWRDTLVARDLDEAGVPRSVLDPMTVVESSVALPSEVGGYALGRFLPMLLVFMTLLGTFYPAIDMAAGERERGTLEALLTAPVPARDIVTGKFLAVAVVGIAAAALNLGSLLLTFQTGLFRFGDMPGMDVGITGGTLGVMALAIVPLAVLFGALFLGIAVRSRSFKEAQNALTPIYMAALIPALLPLLPGMDLSPLLAAVPVAGTTLLLRDALGGEVDLVEGMIVIGSSLLWAWLGLRVAASAFGSEGVLFGVAPPAGGDDTPGAPAADGQRDRVGTREGAGANEGVGDTARAGESVDVAEAGRVADLAGTHPSTGPSRPRPPFLPAPVQAAFFIAGVAVLFFYGGRTIPVLLGEAGLLVAQVAFLLVPALLFVRAGRFDFVSTLALRRPGMDHLTAGLLIILGGLPIAWGLAWLQSLVMPLPEEFLRAMGDLLSTQDPARILWLLLLVAITPAICEEVVFRGVLLQSTRSLGARRAILLNAGVFAAFHLSFETAFRFLPTFWLGLLLATTVWITRSLWVGMLMHAVNNGTVVLLSAVPALRESMADPSAPPPLVLIPLGVVLLAMGFRVLLRQAPTLPQNDPGGYHVPPRPPRARPG